MKVRYKVFTKEGTCFFFFYNLHIALKNIGRITYTIAFIWCKTVLVNLSLDIICSSRLTVFLPLRSRRTVRLLEQIESAQNFAPNERYYLYKG